MILRKEESVIGRKEIKEEGDEGSREGFINKKRGRDEVGYRCPCPKV